MPFLTTSYDAGRGVKSHYHTAYVNAGTQVGETSLDDDHFHKIVLDPSDPDSAPLTGLVVLPALGHHHMLETEYPAERLIAEVGEDGGAKEEEDDAEDAEGRNQSEEAAEIQRIGALFAHADALESESIQNGMDDEKMYSGDQWPELDDVNDDTDIITVNVLESKVDLLGGYLAQNKTDFKFYPVEAGDGRWSQMLDAIAKVDFVDAYDYHSEEAAVFSDACIAGRGWFNCYVSYDRHHKGNLVIEQYPWNAVRCGPHRRADMCDLEYLIKFKWISLARLKVLYPKANLKDIEERMNTFAGAGISGRTMQYELVDPYSVHTSSSNSESAIAGVDASLFSAANLQPERREVVVYECWEKHYIQNVELYNEETEETYKATGWHKDDIESIQSIPGVEALVTDGVRMHVTVVAGGKILKKGYPNLPYQGFHMVPLYAKKRGNRFWSKIRAGYDLQQVINKRFVQAVDEVNRSASGWLVDDQCFIGTQKVDFENAVCRSNFVAMIKDLAHPPTRVSPTTNIAALEGLIEISSGKLNEILGIQPEMFGMNSKAESGIAIFQKQRAGLMGNVFLFESLSNAKKTLARIIAHYIQANYDPKRVLRILKNSQLKKKMLGVAEPQQGEPGADANTDIFGLTEDDLKRFFETFDAGKYDYAVGEARENPTMRMTWFQIWNDYASTHPDLPPEFLLALSDQPEKDRLFAILEKARAHAQEAEMEMVKARVKTGPGGPVPGGQPNSPAAALPAPVGPEETGPIAGSTAGAALPPEIGILTP